MDAKKYYFTMPVSEETALRAYLWAKKNLNDDKNITATKIRKDKGGGYKFGVGSESDAVAVKLRWL